MTKRSTLAEYLADKILPQGAGRDGVSQSPVEDGWGEDFEMARVRSDVTIEHINGHTRDFYKGQGFVEVEKEPHTNCNFRKADAGVVVVLTYSTDAAFLRGTVHELDVEAGSLSDCMSEDGYAGA